jgi:hypothetical protein
MLCLLAIFSQVVGQEKPTAVPENGWFCLLRLYSPTEPWFDKSWRPGEIELVD